MNDNPMADGRATMDFFAHQDRARGRTKLLVALYVVSVLVTCVAVAAAVVIAALVASKGDVDAAPLAGFAAAGAAGAALLIAGGTAYRISELRGGGSVVALQLGGRPIDESTSDPSERRVLNVVEEMAIASGVPVPPVYMMGEERGINAFAAGYEPSDAVIGVTRGCVDGLTRDELQGVMAHEFSHILNGDMRTNIRLVGVLGGIVLLSLAGYTLLRATAYSGGGRGRRDGRGVAGMMVLAIALVAIGGIGSVCARLIQAAVSRQREFLADASAVQFTRNPGGIAGALRRIGGGAQRANIENAHAREMSHMFFGNAVASSFLGSALASHPPLPDRIRRVDPNWDGSMLDPLERSPAPSTARRPAAESSGGPLSPREQLERLRDRRMGREQAAEQLAGHAAIPLLALIGTATPQHVAHARGMLDRLPAALREAAHDPYGCRAVVYALLMHWSSDDASLRAQLDVLQRRADFGVLRVVRALETEAASLDRDLRLPLLELCLAPLQRLSRGQLQSFARNTRALAEADGRIEPFEWALLRVLESHVEAQLGRSKDAITRSSLNRLGKEAAVVLSVLARAGAEDDESAWRAFEAGARAIAQVPTQFRETAFDHRALDAALGELRGLVPQQKRRLIEACAAVVGADGDIAPGEAELFRALAAVLGVPMPPLLPGQRVA
ncbi:MAG: M48 family metallopeptidase [Planctomycetota bacterium]